MQFKVDGFCVFYIFVHNLNTRMQFDLVQLGHRLHFHCEVTLVAVLQTVEAEQGLVVDPLGELLSQLAREIALYVD